MSVASTVERVAVTITALPQVIPVFAFNQAGDLVCYDGGSGNTGNSPALLLALGSDYTVSGGGYNAQNQLQAGNVTIVAGGSQNVQVGDVITVLRNISLVQSTTFASTGLQTPLMIEADDDKLTMIAQQLADGITRSLRFPSVEALDGTLPPATKRALMLQGYDLNGVPLLYPLGSVIVASGSQIQAASISALKAVSVTGLVTGQQAVVSGYYAINDGGGGLYVYNSGSAAADNGGSVIAPAVGSGRWLLNVQGFVSVRQFGAKGDNAQDDTAYIRNALSAFSDVYAPTGTYRITSVVDLFANSKLYGNGNSTVFSFQPASAPNDRAFRIDSNISAFSAITGAIAIGATTFTATTTTITSQLVAGDWVQVYETDHPTGSPDDICNFDWMQVASVAGAVVTVTSPFRTAFSGTHVTYGFTRIAAAALYQNITLRDFKVTTQVNGNTPIGINVQNCRHITIDNVEIIAPGNTNTPPLFIYRCSDVIIKKCRVINGGSDVGGCVDVNIEGCFFGSEGTAAPLAPCLTVETGVGFFSITNNTFLNASDIMLNLQLGGHDGVIKGNRLGWVSSPDANLGDGIALQGFKRVQVEGNILAGGTNNGATTGNAGITTSDTANFVGANITSSDNLIIGNIVKNFLNRFVTASADTLLDTASGSVAGTNAGLGAPVGAIGEYFQDKVLSAAAVTLSTGTPNNVQSRSLPAGDWDIQTVIYFKPADATTVVQWMGTRVSTTSADGIVNDEKGYLTSPGANANTVDMGICGPRVKLYLTAATTVYTIAEAAFTVAGLKAYATTTYRRVGLK